MPIHLKNEADHLKIVFKKSMDKRTMRSRNRDNVKETKNPEWDNYSTIYQKVRRLLWKTFKKPSPWDNFQINEDHPVKYKINKGP